MNGAFRREAEEACDDIVDVASELLSNLELLCRNGSLEAHEEAVDDVRLGVERIVASARRVRDSISNGGRRRATTRRQSNGRASIAARSRQPPRPHTR
jgi:hypothetical protein